MKKSIVPAQVMTVEDQIFFSLTPLQLILMLAPLLIGFMLFLSIPPKLQFNEAKVIPIAFLEVVGMVLSVRVKGRILLYWLLLISKYNARPGHYTYNKNDLYLRNVPVDGDKDRAEPQPTGAVVKIESGKQVLTLAEVIRIEGILADPRAKVRYITGKDGRLNVVIQEIKY